MVSTEIKTHRNLDFSSIIFSVIIFSVFTFSFNSCSYNINNDTYFLKGETFYSEGNLDSAQFYYSKILESDSNNTKAINQLAEIHFRKVEIKTSLMFLTRSISIDSTNEESYFKIAEIKLFFGNYKDVFKNINKGLKINERKPEAYFMKGVAYKHIGDTNKAISSFKTAIELKHDFAKVYYELGLLLTLQRDSVAIDYYKRGIEVSSNDAGLKYCLAWSYDQFNKLTEADKAYNKVVSDFPYYIEAKGNYATFKYKLNQVDTALLLCNQVLDFDSLNSTVLNLKGMILKEKGFLIESKKIKDKLLLMNSQLEL